MQDLARSEFLNIAPCKNKNPKSESRLGFFVPRQARGFLISNKEGNYVHRI